MQKTRKSYEYTEEEPMTANEPALAYETAIADVSTSEKWDDYCTNGAVPNTHPSTSGKWNPNVPFHCTQEEFEEHIHSIEQGNFVSWEEHQKKFYAWKEKFLASRI